MAETIEVMAEFPYLSDENIQHLKPSVLYRTLGSVKATDTEVELIKQKRRRLQKLHFKHKKDSIMNEILDEMNMELEDLVGEKNELLKLRQELQIEIGQFKKVIEQEN